MAPVDEDRRLVARGTRFSSTRNGELADLTVCVLHRGVGRQMIVETAEAPGPCHAGPPG